MRSGLELPAFREFMPRSVGPGDQDSGVREGREQPPGAFRRRHVERCRQRISHHRARSDDRNCDVVASAGPGRRIEEVMMPPSMGPGTAGRALAVDDATVTFRYKDRAADPIARFRHSVAGS
jgi:hypothetical protein